MRSGKRPPRERAEQVEKIPVLLPVLLGEVADDGIRFFPRMRLKSEPYFLFLGNRRQLEEVSDENYLQSAERFFRHHRSATKRAQHPVDAVQCRRIEHGYLVYDEDFRAENPLRRLLAALYHFDVVITHFPLDADAAPRMNSHAAYMCGGNSRRSGDGGLHSTLAQPCDVSIDSVRLAAPRLAREKNVQSCFQNRERFVLRHRTIITHSFRGFEKLNAVLGAENAAFETYACTMRKTQRLRNNERRQFCKPLHSFVGRDA